MNFDQWFFLVFIRQLKNWLYPAVDRWFELDRLIYARYNKFFIEEQHNDATGNKLKILRHFEFLFLFMLLLFDYNKGLIINQLTIYSSWIPKARLKTTSINKQLICCRFAVPWWEEKHHPTLTGAVRPSFFNVNGWINTTKQVPVISQFTGYINPSFWQLLQWSLD